MLESIGMFADPGYARFTRRHVLLPSGLDRVYLLVYVSAERNPDHAPPCFHLLKQRPGFFGELIGQGLEEPGAARRIDHPIQVALLMEDQLRAASQTTRDFVTGPYRSIQWQGGNHISPTDSRGKTCGCVPQQVDPRVMPG